MLLVTSNVTGKRIMERSNDDTDFGIVLLLTFGIIIFAEMRSGTPDTTVLILTLIAAASTIFSVAFGKNVASRVKAKVNAFRTSRYVASLASTSAVVRGKTQVSPKARFTLTPSERPKVVRRVRVPMTPPEKPEKPFGETKIEYSEEWRLLRMLDEDEDGEVK